MMSKRARSATAAHPPYLGFLGHHDYSYSDLVYLAETMCNSEEWAEFSPVVVKSGDYVGVDFECEKDALGDVNAGIDVREDCFYFNWTYSTPLKQRITSPRELHQFISEVARLSRILMRERGRAVDFRKLEHQAHEFDERKFIMNYIALNPAWARFGLYYTDDEETREVYGEIVLMKNTIGLLKLPGGNLMQLWWQNQMVRERRVTSMTELNEFVEWAMDYAEDNTPIRFYTRRA